MRALGDSTGRGAKRAQHRALVLVALFALLLLVLAPHGEDRVDAKKSPHKLRAKKAVHPGKNGLIAFDSDRMGSQDIWLMNKNGTGAFRLFAGQFDDDVEGPLDRAPAWAPEGGALAFESTRSGYDPGCFSRSTCGFDFDIWTINLNGTGLTDITPTSDADDTDPAWSADGRLIAFETSRDGGDRDIAIMRTDGSNFQQLTHEGGMEAPPDEENPVFSQDGRKIFYQSDSGDLGHDQIWSMNLDGSGPKQLTFPPGQSMEPDVSPDNTQILFASDRHAPGAVPPKTDLYVMNTDGTNPRRLAITPGEVERPVFAPDGLRVAFGLFSTNPFAADIYGMNFDTTQLGPLSPQPTDDDRRPDWQPVRYRCNGEFPTIVGSIGDESIVGTPGEDVIIALGGQDSIKGLEGNDILCGDFGRDTLNGGPGDDILIGGPQADKLKGQKGADGLYGGTPGSGTNNKDQDACFGGKGTDNAGKGCDATKTL